MNTFTDSAILTGTGIDIGGPSFGGGVPLTPAPPSPGRSTNGLATATYDGYVHFDGFSRCGRVRARFLDESRHAGRGGQRAAALPARPGALRVQRRHRQHAVGARHGRRAAPAEQDRRELEHGGLRDRVHRRVVRLALRGRRHRAAAAASAKDRAFRRREIWHLPDVPPGLHTYRCRAPTFPREGHTVSNGRSPSRRASRCRDGPSTEDLVRAAARGDERAWSALVDEFSPVLRRVAGGFRLDAHRVEDVVQVTWIRLLVSIRAIAEPAAVPGWLVTTVRREAIRALRDAGRTRAARGPAPSSVRDATPARGRAARRGRAPRRPAGRRAPAAGAPARPGRGAARPSRRRTTPRSPRSSGCRSAASARSAPAASPGCAAIRGSCAPSPDPPAACAPRGVWSHGRATMRTPRRELPVRRRISSPELVGRREELGLIDDLLAQRARRSTRRSASWPARPASARPAWSASSSTAPRRRGCCACAGSAWPSPAASSRSRRWPGSTARSPAELDRRARPRPGGAPPARRPARPARDGVPAGRARSPRSTRTTPCSSSSVASPRSSPRRSSSRTSTGPTSPRRDFLRCAGARARARAAGGRRHLPHGRARARPSDARARRRADPLRPGRSTSSSTRLTREQTAEQLAAIAGQAVPAGAVDAVHARAHGNPFLTEELWAAGGPAAVPARLGDTLLARVRALPEEAQRVLRLLAVFGRPAGEELVAAAAGQPGDTVALARRAVREHILEPADGGQLAFRHALVREALYAELLPGRARGAAPRRRGRLEAGRQPGRAGLPPPRGRPARRGARRLGRRGARGRAARRLSRGARPLRARARPVGRRRAGAGRDAGARPPRRPPRGGRGGAPHGRVRPRDRALPRRARAARRRPRPRARRRVLRAPEPLRELGRGARPGGGGAGAGAARSRAVGGAGARADRPGAPAEHARTLARGARRAPRRRSPSPWRAGARAEECWARSELGIALAFDGDADAGEHCLRRALALAEEQAAPEEVARTYVNLAELERLRGRTGAALAAMRDGPRAGGGDGHRARRGARSWPCSPPRTCSSWAAGRSSTRCSTRTRDVNAGRAGAVLWPLVAGRLALARGQLEPAAELLERARASALRGVTPELLPHVGAALAELRLWQGDAAGGAAARRRGVPADRRPRGRAQHAAAALRGRARRGGDRGARRSRRGPRRARGARAGGGARARGWMRSRGPGAAATAGAGLPRPGAAELAERGDAARRWASAAAAWDELADPQSRRVCALPRRGGAALGARRAGGGDAVAAARARDGLRARRAAPLPGDRGARAPCPPPAGPPPRSPPRAGRGDALGLTRREAEVLALVADGLTNRQIAERLFIAPKTAGLHVSHILAKLNVDSRVKAAAVAHRVRLGEPHDAPDRPAEAGAAVTARSPDACLRAQIRDMVADLASSPQIGGQLREMFWTLGPYDIALYAEVRDPVAAHAFSLTLSRKLKARAPRAAGAAGRRGGPGVRRARAAQRAVIPGRAPLPGAAAPGRIRRDEPRHRPRCPRLRRPDGDGDPVERPPGLEGDLGGVRAARRVELRRDRALRPSQKAGEPDRHADGVARVRVVRERDRDGEPSAAVHARAGHRRAVGRRVPAPRDDVPVRADRERHRPADRYRGLPDLHARERAGAAGRDAGRPRLRRLPAEPAADRPR